jgi:hypothetical protein
MSMARGVSFGCLSHTNEQTQLRKDERLQVCVLRNGVRQREKWMSEDVSRKAISFLDFST